MHGCTSIYHITDGGGLMEIPDLDKHRWIDYLPVRLPVEWEYTGKPGIHPDIEGVTGKNVVFLITKTFNRFERLLTCHCFFQNYADNTKRPLSGR